MNSEFDNEGVAKSFMDSSLVLLSQFLILVGVLLTAYFWLGFSIEISESIYPNQVWAYVVGLSAGTLFMAVAFFLGPVIMYLFTTVSIWMWVGWMANLSGFFLYSMNK